MHDLTMTYNAANVRKPQYTLVHMQRIVMWKYFTHIDIGVLILNLTAFLLKEKEEGGC